MSGHGIDVCACGAVIRQCRCMGPHVPRIVQQTCPTCIEAEHRARELRSDEPTGRIGVPGPKRG